ncbi:MAG: class I SAM-dependent methyltransferase family protein [Candidatus Heimdallarchaeota archaeon]
MTTFHSQVSSILRKKIPDNHLQLLPRGWNRLGHIAILSLHETLTPYRTLIGKACLSILKNVQTIARKVGPTFGTFRTPQLEVIAGENRTETIHKEHGCLFELDAAQITFSSGNHFERKRLIEVVEEGASVVDMFACVGNLSIPLAVHKKAQVIGIELNPVAFEFLTRNIKRNKIETRYQPLFGDNRDLTPENWADHVLLGCWGWDDLQIARGIRVLKVERGGWLHIHELVPPRQVASAIQKVKENLLATPWGFRVEQYHTRRVKEVGPCFFHVVTDLQLSPG